jgi:hypothetical protein
MIRGDVIRQDCKRTHVVKVRGAAKALPNTADGGYKYFGRQSYNGLAAFSLHPNQTLEYRLYGTVQASPLL